MERISSREITAWMAYEKAEGPIGTRWQDEMIAAIHEQLQRLNHIQGAAHFTDRKHRKNPVPSPKHVPRPHELFRTDRDEDDLYDAEEDQLDTAASTFGGEEEGGDPSGDDHSDGVPDQLVLQRRGDTPGPA